MPARGPPNAVIRQCPRTRPLAYSYIWYRLGDEPDFLVCSQCYECHIRSTSLADSFLRFRSETGSPLRCRFWVHTMSAYLWPHAVIRDDLTDVVDYAKRRTKMLDCAGFRDHTQSAGTVWYQPSDPNASHFLCCSACYEDYISSTIFAPYFIPKREQLEEGQVWICDFHSPFMSNIIPSLAKTGNWDEVRFAISLRKQLPVCQAQWVEVSSCGWVTVPELEGHLWICESCYLDRIVLTPFRDQFKSVSQRITFNIDPGRKIRCALSYGPMMVALEAAISKHDFKVFFDAAQIVLWSRFCDSAGISDDDWYTLKTVPGHFHICKACYTGIMTTWQMRSFFQKIEREPGRKQLCDLNPAAHEFLPLVEHLAQAVDVQDFSRLSDFVRQFLAVPPCPDRTALTEAEWYTFDSCAICPRCYGTYTTDTSLAERFTLQKLSDPTICSLGSPRMRRKWTAACKNGSIQDFVTYSDLRSQVHKNTIAIADLIKDTKLARLDLAGTYGKISSIYSDLEREAQQMVSENDPSTGDGHTACDDHGGYTAERRRWEKLMHQKTADANRSDEWRVVERLERLWEEVE